MFLLCPETEGTPGQLGKERASMLGFPDVARTIVARSVSLPAGATRKTQSDGNAMPS